MAKEKVRLGGMALANGVLVHGPHAWAVAIRGKDGGIEVASARKRLQASRVRNPLLRGPARLLEALALLPQVKAKLPAARLPMESPSVLVSMLGAAVLVRGLRESPLRPLARELLSGFASFAPALLALRAGDLAAYHGAEHKTIAAYEQGVVDDVASVPKEHDRCGSNLIVPMMLLSAGGTVLLERLVEKPSNAARAGVALGGASLAVEMFAWSDRHHGDQLAEAFHTPGREIQRHWATKEPSPEQLEVAVAALEEILRAEAA
jgi:uncharacterized protein YqhQ